ncbi:MAG: lyase family protein [Actinomycetota bacterium]|nr:lyase family protein [Actinomycetota bacterium]
MSDIRPSAELIEGGFALETAYAPALHDGLNLADLAHVLDLRERHVIPEPAARDLLAALLDIDATEAEEFPYRPADGEPYNSRERVLVERIGSTAGWLHAGRPRREATRIAFRLHLRRSMAGLIGDVAVLAQALAQRAEETASLLFPDQTYLQQAQPSTVAHYLLSFAYPVVRDGYRLATALDWVNRSPGGAGCVNGTRLSADRESLAALLGFDGVIANTRDAMWQTDGLVELLATLASVALTQDALAEDLEIWASTEFDFVTLGDGYTRASVLMPQKRNPYSLSIIRGASAVMTGQVAGFLALQKGPSARSDKLIFAYREIPGALDLAGRILRLSRGVVATLVFNQARMAAALNAGFSQATDLADHLMTACGLDYRTAYRVVGLAVQQVAAAGRTGIDLTAGDLAAVAAELTGAAVEVDPDDLASVLDPAAIVATRAATGGAAPGPIKAMIEEVQAQADQLARLAQARSSAFTAAETGLRDRAAAAAGRLSQTIHHPTRHC